MPPMSDGRARDPVQVVRDILADGPLNPADFRRMANERGVSFRELPKAARLAGAECRRTGRPGEGAWVWQIRTDIDRFITTKPNRSGLLLRQPFSPRQGNPVQTGRQPPGRSNPRRRTAEGTRRRAGTGPRSQTAAADTARAAWGQSEAAEDQSTRPRSITQPRASFTSWPEPWKRKAASHEQAPDIHRGHLPSLAA